MFTFDMYTYVGYVVLKVWFVNCSQIIKYNFLRKRIWTMDFLWALYTKRMALFVAISTNSIGFFVALEPQTSS